MKPSGDSIRVVHPLFQTESDGAIPISPLQLEILECHISTACNLNAYWHSRLPEIMDSNVYRSPPAIAFVAIHKNIYYATALWSGPVARQLNGKGYIELRRMAIADDAPKNTASRMLKVMRKIIVRKFPEVRRLISYQDTEVHSGTIYKASGWQPTTKSTVSSKGWNSRERNKMQTTSDKIRWEYEL